MRKIPYMISGLLLSMFTLSACYTTPEPVHADDVVRQQQEKNAPTQYNEVRETFHNIFPLVEQDLIENYDIKAVDVPQVDNDKTFRRKQREIWVASFLGENIEPAEIRVLTEDNNRYTYQVVLIDNKAVLFHVENTQPEPHPDELFKNNESPGISDSDETRYTEDTLPRTFIDQVELDIEAHYDVTGVNTHADTEKNNIVDVVMKDSRYMGEDWVEQARNNDLEPAKIDIRTHEYNTYTYEVMLEDDQAVLYPLSDSATKTPDIGEIPSPEELLKN